MNKSKSKHKNVEIPHYNMSDYKCDKENLTEDNCIKCVKNGMPEKEYTLRCPWEWIQYWDEEAKARYWYNPITGEASWIKPEDMNTNSEFKFKQPEDENNKITGGKKKKSNKRMNKKQLKKLAVKALKTKKVQNSVNRKICNIFPGDAKKACTTEFDKSFIKSFIRAYQKANASKKKISGRNQKHKTIKRRSKK